MPNVLLTNYCNRNCSYCFGTLKIRKKASDRVKVEKRHLTAGELEKVMDFLPASRFDQFPVIGGEPTLHPDFPDIIDRILHRNYRAIKIFSNGMIKDGYLDYLEKLPDEKIHITLNTNHPDTYSSGEWQKLNNTMSRLNNKVSLGINIFKRAFDPQFLLDLICKHKLKKAIRIAIAQPVLEQENEFLRIEDYHNIAPGIVKLAEVCDGLNISLKLDCGFILCMFSEAQLGKLVSSNSDFRFFCKPIIDIGPTLQVWSCFPFSNWNITEMGSYNNYDEAADYYENKFRPYKQVGSMEKCLGCKHLLRRQCTGGCLAHTVSLYKSSLQ